MQGISVDTSGWLAFAHEKDSYHSELEALFKNCVLKRMPLHTSDYVLDELISLLFRRVSFGKAVQFIDGLPASTNIHHVNPGRFQAAMELRKRLQDKTDISFTDLTSMVLMRELELKTVITLDRHFSIVGMGFESLPAK